jgi:hypothetical protein
MVGVTLTLGVTEPAFSADIETDPAAKQTDHDPSVFRPDPSYEDTPYDIDAQLEIYGGKSKFVVTRPLIEAGRELYTAGPLGEQGTGLGALNPTSPEFYVYGDWRTAVAFNDNGANELGLVATRLNLDFDFRFTSTERIHWFIGPLDNGGEFTRCEFAGGNRPGGDADEFCEVEADLNLDTLFFEGDVGPIYSGLSGEYTSLDLPFSVGLMPLLYQNGVWLEDAFTGFAFAIPALNSPRLDISNMDISFFFGFDKVTTDAVVDANGAFADHDANIYGVAAFVEANQGFWEGGIAYIDAKDDQDDASYVNMTLAFSKRYRDWFSNSVRVVYATGQERDNNVQETAEGIIFLIENSLITSLPSTLLPYFNVFAGFDRPQSAARAAAAGGILKNTGINFETDALTGFPKLDDTGQNTFGGALGVQYLFSLDQQIVVEAATNQVIEGDNEVGRGARGDEYAIGVRYQLPLTEAWLIRADAMHGWRDEDDNLAGVRFEVRRKF